MKKVFYLLFLLASSAIVHANVIIVKGYVKQANGTPVANKEVKIQVYLNASTSACHEQVMVTDHSGYYSKEMSCTGDIRRSRISLKNCDGTMLVLEKEVPLSQKIEANFVACHAATSACAPKFIFEPVHPSSTIPALSVRFNSSASEVGSGDKIVERKWDFRDGSPLLLNRVDPLHTFPRAGTYEVCLIIKTALGCEKKVCKQVVVPPVPHIACAAKFSFERLSPKKFRFNSSLTVIGRDDRIIERKWDFRDGTTSNEIAPLHEFQKAGIYEVCLIVKTANGCESKICSAVKVEEVPHTSDARIEIVSLYPSPVRETLKVVLFSKHNNIPATVSIIDERGVVQYSSQLTLLEGYNPMAIQVSNLKPGSYAFKVTTRFGSVTKRVFKI